MSDKQHQIRFTNLPTVATQTSRFTESSLFFDFNIPHSTPSSARGILHQHEPRHLHSASCFLLSCLVCGCVVERATERRRRMRIAWFVALASVASAFTSPSLRTKNDVNAIMIMLRSSSDEETSRRRFLGSAAAIAALFPQVAHAAPTKKVGGLANKIRNVGNVMVRPSKKSVRYAHSCLCSPRR